MVRLLLRIALASILLAAAPACGSQAREPAAAEEETAPAETAPPRRTAEATFVRATIAAAKRHGFFGEETVAEAVARVRREYWQEWGEPLDPQDEFSKLIVLGYDRKRVWWNDTEMDVIDGNDMYVTTLGEWARISRGAFEPTEVVETWHGEQGPVEVTYRLRGERVTLRPAYVDDYLDMEILCDINKQLAGSDIRFELVEPFDQTAYVVALTAHEHEGAARLLPNLRRNPCGRAGDAAEMGQEFEDEVLGELEGE